MDVVERLKNMDDLLASNRAAVGSTSLKGKKGMDDKMAEPTVHPRRFLPGADCSTAKL
jgi:hypothetical protein